MDARAVQKLLDKTFGLAETAMLVGAKTTEVALRDVRLPDTVRQKLIPLYGEETLRRTLNYAGLGLAVCRAIEHELDDNAARAQVEFYRTRLSVIYDDAQAALERDFAASDALIAHPLDAQGEHMATRPRDQTERGASGHGDVRERE